jgi:hypothetical protein
MTVTVRLTGQQLLDYVKEANLTNTTRTEMVKGAGYVDNDRALYVDFYTELLKAREVLDPTYVSKQEAEDAEYEDLSTDEQELYDEVHRLLGEKWDHDEIMQFMEALDDIGITTAESLRESFEFIGDDPWCAEEEFAKYFTYEVLNASIPDIVEDCINWQQVYDSSLRYDYDSVDFDGFTYFFRNI